MLGRNFGALDSKVATMLLVETVLPDRHQTVVVAADHCSGLTVETCDKQSKNSQQLKINMDKSGINMRNRLDPLYEKGADDFVEFAPKDRPNAIEILYPCTKCGNMRFTKKVNVAEHIVVDVVGDRSKEMINDAFGVPLFNQLDKIGSGEGNENSDDLDDDNLLRHKNMYVITYCGRLLNIDDTRKDNLNARNDLKEMGIRKALHPQQRAGNEFYLPPSSFTLDNKNKYDMPKVLKRAKVSDDYASNISRRTIILGSVYTEHKGTKVCPSKTLVEHSAQAECFTSSPSCSDRAQGNQGLPEQNLG
ncbi:hypothetical protein RJ639_015332 [Escallonia herrerae]|uniref:Transposase-associated domain-containing protein n=1 Tax=Escallonia herrerae TaxID=1293975 RepID=A0AA88VGC7_9ASTE|nr:hypothetical protein RJ639_015332 [Escallonia herrerae]